LNEKLILKSDFKIGYMVLEMNSAVVKVKKVYMFNALINQFKIILSHILSMFQKLKFVYYNDINKYSVSSVVLFLSSLYNIFWQRILHVLISLSYRSSLIQQIGQEFLINIIIIFDFIISQKSEFISLK
jgi:hypothetical protein